jgi:hypothetical protein
MPVANTTQDYASDKCRQVEPYRIGSTDEPPAIGNLEYMFFTFFHSHRSINLERSPVTLPKLSRLQIMLTLDRQ